MSGPESKPSHNQEEQTRFDPNAAAGRLAVEASAQEAEPEHQPYQIMELDDPETSFAMRRFYLRNTFRLTEKIQRTKPDYVIYLDKSGRPVSWLENELYDDFIEAAAGEDEEPWPKPGTLFLNIDREHWRDHTGGKEYGSGQIDVRNIDKEAINSLRSILLKQNPEATEEEIADLPSLIDGGRVLIVDEVKFTGDTLKIAQKLMEAAFPDVDFYTHHWMTSPKAVDPNAKTTGLPDVPVWYKQNSERGREVANRNKDKSRQSSSWRQRMGELFLSTRFDSPDQASRQLRREFDQLAEEYRDGVYGEVTY